MKKDRLEITSGIVSLTLLISLLAVLRGLPGGMILPGFFIGGIIVIGVVAGAFVVALVLKLVFRNYSFLTIFSILTAVCFAFLHYYFYSPTLKIVVPKGYAGAVNLVLSNVDKNRLTVDSNGVGYINEWTFEKTYRRPIVTETDGNRIDDRCVGFNGSTFWANSYFVGSPSKVVINSLTFKILGRGEQEPSQEVDRNLGEIVDTALVLRIR